MKARAADCKIQSLTNRLIKAYWDGMKEEKGDMSNEEYFEFIKTQASESIMYNTIDDCLEE